MSDLVGQRFGQLTVIERRVRPEQANNNETYWMCLCDCGKKIVTRRSMLTRKKGRRSCGCKSLRGTFIDLTGRRFSRLLVIKRVALESRYPIWLCKCDCGTETEVDGRNLRCIRTRSCGCLQREATRRKKAT